MVSVRGDECAERFVKNEKIRGANNKPECGKSWAYYPFNIAPFARIIPKRSVKDLL
jgi:hypothetical protein